MSEHKELVLLKADSQPPSKSQRLSVYLPGDGGGHIEYLAHLRIVDRL